MKHTFLALSVAAAMTGFASTASAVTVNFTDEESPGVSCCGLMASGAYAAYGLTVDNVYWYADSRDTFDGEGVSIYEAPTATITFAAVSPTVGFEYWVIGGNRGSYEAFDSSWTSLGTLAVDASAGDVLGTHVFGGGVKYLTFTGSSGFAQVSAVTFAPVPEPGTYALMLGGLGIVGWMARRRQS